MKLLPEQLRELVSRHGFAERDVAVAVAIAESGGHTDAKNIVTQQQADAWNAAHPDAKYKHGPERSFGLWQMNALANPDDEAKLLDPDYNAQAALKLSNGGKDWHHWSTFTDGTYKQFMPSGASPAPAPAPAPSDAIDLFVIAVVAAGLAYMATRKLKVPA